MSSTEEDSRVTAVDDKVDDYNALVSRSVSEASTSPRVDSPAKRKDSHSTSANYAAFTPLGCISVGCITSVTLAVYVVPHSKDFFPLISFSLFAAVVFTLVNEREIMKKLIGYRILKIRWAMLTPAGLKIAAITAERELSSCIVAGRA